MKQCFINILTAVRYILLHALFWLITFAVQRILFFIINGQKALEAGMGNLAGSMLHGLVFDLSIYGYLTIVFMTIIALLSPWVRMTLLIKIFNVISAVVSSVVVILLPADSIVYSYWGYHFDATALGMLSNPSLVFASTENWAIVLYIIVAIVLVLCNLGLLYALMHSLVRTPSDTPHGAGAKAVQLVVCLLLAGVLFIPVRGGTGIAPLNTGRAYFCQNQFANHAALNPAWNFIYSTKRLKKENLTYSFMPDSVAEARFAELMSAEGHSPRILTTRRPNVVIILLESFSAHAIEYLGGYNATPNIKALLHESVAFNNITSASDRSGKGLVAAMCGYPVMPTISIIQYPKKTQSLSYIAKTLKRNGYDSQTFLYGGDLNFNNFNSLVNIAGFRNVVTETDFSSETMGDKWGAHDEYTFQRLLEIMDKQEQPFFNFFFTLSSHEPFTVPMETKIDDIYLNSVCYTDSCLGAFMNEARQHSWWDKTLFILVADHGHPGSDNVDVTHDLRFRIPLIFTGGALAVRDTMVTKYGSQIDLAATLLSQLDIPTDDFTFSKNLLDPTTRGFSFFDFNDGFGFLTDTCFQVYDNPSGRWLRYDNTGAEPDSLSGKAFLQMMSKDYSSR